jgi:hypothetical protein
VALFGRPWRDDPQGTCGARLIDLAREVNMRWPFLPVILTSGHPRERVGQLPPGVAYMPKPWRPLKVLIAAE